MNNFGLELFQTCFVFFDISTSIWNLYFSLQVSETYRIDREVRHAAS